MVSLLFHDVYVTDPSESGFSSPAADRYKLQRGDFARQLDSIDGASAVRLTFDDGGESFYTVVADEIERRGWRGHCFVTTGCIGQSGFLTRAQIRELDGRGHVIGAHSHSHPARFSALSEGEMRREWIASRAMLEDIVGHPVTSASVPGGYFSKIVAATAADSGIRLLFNSEPVCRVRPIGGCEVAGRFTLRRGEPPDLAGRLARRAPWARAREWAAWNAKAAVKPILGASYPRVADWVQARMEES